jgi:hypothetical protein
MKPAEYVSIGVTAAMLTPVITWLTTWPIQAPYDAQAAAISAVLIAAIGGIDAMCRMWWPPKP